MTSIKTKHILQQLKADLIGKDSHRGVTLSYAWLANQIAHFSMGFIPTYLFYNLFNWLDWGVNSVFYATGLVCFIWLAFEAYNFLGPLLLSKKRSSQFLSAKKVFEHKWFNVGFDTVTDVLFFWCGATLAGVTILPHTLLIVSNIVITLLLIYPSYYWYLTKIYQQKASYPFQFRLSQWAKNLSESNIEEVKRYNESQSTKKHLLVFGSKNTGKSSLSIGITNEKSIDRNACTYTTAIKLISDFSNQQKDEDLPWDWRTSEYLVIDDINPGKPIDKDIIDAKLFSEILIQHPKSKNILCNKNVIWVAGDNDSPVFSTSQIYNTWKELLVGIGVEEEDVFIVDLSS